MLFLRSVVEDDPVHHLWRLDVETGAESLLVDVSSLPVRDDLPPEELRRRERQRESGSGITSYATDRAGDFAAFALGGELFTVDVRAGLVEPLQGPPGAFDPRPSPDESQVACIADGQLWVTPVGGAPRRLVGEDGVTWGVAEFAAAEEMGRQRGYWWAPSSDRLAVARVDEASVTTWHIADPANPDQPAVPHRYPAAGTTNAEVRLFVVGLDGNRVEVDWDRAAFEYLAAVDWSEAGLSALVVARDQRRAQLLRVDEATGATAVEHELTDDAWVDLVAGTPGRLADGRSVLVAPVDGEYRLLVGGTPVTDAMNVARVLDINGDEILFVAHEPDEPTADVLCRWGADGFERVTDEPGVHGGRLRGDVLVVVRAHLEGPTTATVLTACGRHEVASFAATPLVTPTVRMSRGGDRRLATGLLLPGADSPWADASSLPVLLDPYGGPHFARVVQAREAWLTPQWFADQGFAVVVVDGRGTPGRGPAWERDVLGDLATPALEDQFDALDALAADEPRLDLGRVAIRGWSFGGYVAALAALRRPDRVRAAIIGAPVSDWRLYDTYYTERYLGLPDANAEAYGVSSVADDQGLRHATTLEAKRAPGMLLIHGLADDNVVAGHTLRLSAALLAAGRPHEFLPLSGVTHMTPQAVVAENLLLHQLDFLRRHLGDTR